MKPGPPRRQSAGLVLLGLLVCLLSVGPAGPGAATPLHRADPTRAAPSDRAGAAAGEVRRGGAGGSRVVAAIAPAFTPSPLSVTLRRLSPSVVPQGRDTEVRVEGRVTNDDDVPWTDLGVYLVTSSEPMTTEEELAAAIASDPATEIGERIVVPGLYTSVPDLEPGESASFDLRVPARRLSLSGDPGVYWLGVHVLGTSPDGRLEGADGRARTFLPLVPDTNPGTSLALGVPLRRHVVRASDGTVNFDLRWADQLAGGRLDRTLRMAQTAQRVREPRRTQDPRPGSTTPAPWPVTLVTDGAVVDAVQSLGDGDPPVDLVADGPSDVTGPGEPDPADAAAEVAADNPTGQAARRWLKRFTRVAAGADVLALPYGDLDVSGVASADAGEVVGTALEASAEALSTAGVGSSPVVAPPEGYLSADGLQVLDPDVRVVLGADAVTREDGDALVRATPRGGSLVASPTLPGYVGPAPAPTTSALAVRQRILADAALHALSPERDEPMVRMLPSLWDPGRQWRQARFFQGLEQPWLRGTSLADLTDPSALGADTVRGEDLIYPQEQADAEVPSYVVAATSGLADRGQTLSELLVEDDEIALRLDRQALLAPSYWSRRFPGVAAERVRNASFRVEDWLDLISVRGPAFVTMSSEQGSFQVTLVNGLDQPVTVGLTAETEGDPLRLTTPGAVDLPPGGRRAMDIDADVTGIGVHQVTLQPVSRTGRPLGESATLSVRTSKVGLILWFIMGGGAVLLFGAITVRTVRRIRAARAERSRRRQARAVA